METGEAVQSRHQISPETRAKIETKLIEVVSLLEEGDYEFGRTPKGSLKATTRQNTFPLYGAEVLYKGTKMKTTLGQIQLVVNHNTLIPATAWVEKRQNSQTEHLMAAGFSEEEARAVIASRMK